VGFLLVVAPLLAALIHAALSVEKLVAQGQQALVTTVNATRASQLLVDAITSMQRNARQYQVLGDETLLGVYNENHQKFMETVERLGELRLSALQRQRLESIYLVESGIHSTITAFPHDAPEVIKGLSQFEELSRDASRMLVDNRKQVQREVEHLVGNGAEVQRSLVLQAMALVPGALILVIVFTLLITRPLRQMDRAIRHLGDGDFSRPANITGPRDLEQLGERLDWMRNRLLEVEQDKTRFLHHISHELKTPLTAVREGSELLAEQIVGSLNAQQSEIASILRDNSVQLQKLIEDLLDFNVASTRASLLHPEEIELDLLIEGVLEDHKVAILARQLKLVVSLKAVQIQGDRGKLETVVDNLVSNAIKYSPDEGNLRIKLDVQGDRVIIEVADSGPGIPEDERRRIFDAFYQGSSSASARVRGTGLGLSIAREYVHAHKGSIEVVDRDEQGARLRVVLPLLQEGAGDSA
jgi:two-component system sensor histidine kinase GlrK